MKRSGSHNRHPNPLNPIMLTAGDMLAQIEPARGGRLTAFIVNGTHIIRTHDDAVTADSAIASKEDWYSGSFPLAPWAGKLFERRIDFRHRAYPVTLADKRQDMHGLVYDTVWDIVHQEASSLTIEYVLDGPAVGTWPCRLTFSQTFELYADRLSITLKASGASADFPLIMGFHPWFLAQTTHGAASVDFVPTHSFQLVDNMRHKTVEIPDRPWDDIFLTDRDPKISWPQGPNIILQSDAPYWVYFEDPSGHFCIEPWTGLDFALHGGQDVPVLKEHASMSLAFTILVET